jgi:hypothetical protein
VNDYSCYCKAPASNDDLACVQKECTATDVQSYIEWAQYQCAAFGGWVTSGSSSPTSTSVAAGASGTSTGSATSFVTVTQSTASATNAGSSSATQAPKSSSSGSSVPIGVIVGPVVGGVVLIGLIAALFIWQRRKRSAKRLEMQSERSTVAASSSGRTHNTGSGVDSAPITSTKRPEMRQDEVEVDDDDSMRRF